ncbi:MAG: 30S ribosomal protein S14 [Alphaproteobacteria bacterium]|jgi:small subunit ribosomal protein S14|nr:30S ribosomal protein S14 [Candidatus Jidaibacter sp.]
MAKKSSIEKNNRRKRMVLRDASKRQALKDIVMNKETSIEERFDATLKLAKLPRNGAKIRIRNRCELSGRSRGFYRKFKLSRIWLRTLAGSGELPGVTKGSW